MNAEARAALIAAFRLCERHTRGKVSIRAVIRIAREELGHRFRDVEARALLGPFQKRDASRTLGGTQKDETPGRIIPSCGTQSDDHAGRNFPITRDAASRACDKVLHVVKLESTSYSPGADENQDDSPANGLPGLEISTPTPSPAQELNARAGSLLDAIAKVRGPLPAGGISEDEWRKKNIAACRKWIKTSNLSNEELLELYTEQCSRWGVGIILISKVRELISTSRPTKKYTNVPEIDDADAFNSGFSIKGVATL